MKVILLQDIEKLGSRGDIVEVADGYARNYLIPRKMVVPATPSNIKQWEEIRRQQAAKLARLKEKAEKLARKLSKVKLTIRVRTGEEDRMYGSVGALDIERALHEKGYTEIDKHMILLEEPIRELGTYFVDIRLHPEVIGKVKVEVLAADVAT